MNRRAVLAIAIVIALDPLTAIADLTGSERQRKADARCRRAGLLRSRRGLTARERRQLERMNCREIDGEWRTALVYQAGE